MFAAVNRQNIRKGLKGDTLDVFSKHFCQRFASLGRSLIFLIFSHLQIYKSRDLSLNVHHSIKSHHFAICKRLIKKS